MNAGGNIHKGDIHYHQGIEKEEFEQRFAETDEKIRHSAGTEIWINGKPLQEKPREREIPLLVIRSPQHVMLANGSQMLTVSEHGEPGMIVTIENPEARVGQKGIRAGGVIALIKFRRQSGELAATSEYGCWVGRHENRITLEPGTSQRLVVGIYSNPKVWKCFNSTLDAPVPHRTPQEMRAYFNRVHSPLEPQLIPFNPVIDAQISVLSKYDGYTLAQKTYRLTTVTGVTGETAGFMYEEWP
jgi:hypothetical protein